MIGYAGGSVVRVVHLVISKPLLVVIGAQLVAYVTLAMLRTVDADEGVFLIASRLLMDGRLPYADFMYTQTPLLPYVYGVWMKLFGFSWYAARLLSAFFATSIGTLVFMSPNVRLEVERWR